jgi:hypothetical protein
MAKKTKFKVNPIIEKLKNNKDWEEVVKSLNTTYKINNVRNQTNP